MSKKPAKMGRPSIPKDDAAEYSNWLRLVDADKRLVLRQYFTEQQLREYDDVLDFCKSVLGALVAGDLTPAIARESRLLLELMFTVVAAKNTASGTPEDAYTDIVAALVSVKKSAPRIQASYTVESAVPDFIEEKTKLLVGEG
jgi:hypothetical protein